jgi:cyclopropane-fatty-acyl-phospholipid synthase
MTLTTSGRIFVAAPGPGIWPDVATVPASAGRARVAQALFSRMAARLPLRVTCAAGPAFGAGGPGSPVMVLHRPADFYRRIGAAGLIGFGESFMAGDWDCDDLSALLTIFARQADSLVPRPLQALRRFYVRRRPAADDGSERNARHNARRHYDLSNDLFALFLDETMTYSSALFAQDALGAPVARDGLLAEAQRRKVDRLLDLARVGPSSRLLEIGTGWGELAIRAAARGAQVLTITLSQEQRALAARRVADAGLSGRVRVELRDYRQVTGEFDAIVSAEMIEAVGERYWPDYFAAIGRLLAPGGRVGLQSITMAHKRMLATRHTHTWVLKYIFPGGLIPSAAAIEDHAARAGLRVAGRHRFGAHYAQTLRIWRERFRARAAEVEQLGFDEVFARMWLLYLSYAEAGFRSGYLDVSQFLLVKDASSG